MLAGAFASVLVLILVVSDWFHFTSLSRPTGRYGCIVSRREDWLTHASAHAPFDSHGVLQLPHGIARMFHAERLIVLRPQYHLFAMRFRTAWPLKATIELEAAGDRTRLYCVKRMPWSSAIITAMWFTLVGVGTLAFLATFILEGGLANLGGLLMALGVTSLGIFVFGFGLVIVSLAYRLEDHRLTQAYDEFRAALASPAAASSARPLDAPHAPPLDDGPNASTNGR